MLFNVELVRIHLDVDVFLPTGGFGRLVLERHLGHGPGRIRRAVRLSSVQKLVLLVRQLHVWIARLLKH